MYAIHLSGLSTNATIDTFVLGPIIHSGAPDAQNVTSAHYDPGVVPANTQAGLPSEYPGSRLNSPAPPEKRSRKAFKMHECPECSQTFSSLRILGDHVKDSHRMKAFKCDNCKFRATRHDNLKSHQKICGSQRQKICTTLSSSATSASAPGVSRTSKKGDTRTSMRSVDLQTQPKHVLPRPHPHPQPQRAKPVETLLGETGGATSSPIQQLDISPLLQSNTFDTGFDNSTVEPSSGLEHENRSLKAQVALLKWEAYHWKHNYWQLVRKQGADSALQ
ncbi:hypothetical protein TWF481_001379 [Arthrobotrys musiformis]|uniref:C2H2-type domain-containing protein n=1 Tax=Arthrobotrys musiformis TaxID=47236 RepID=A0AAV9WSP8_9PEZI